MQRFWPHSKPRHRTTYWPLGVKRTVLIFGTNFCVRSLTRTRPRRHLARMIPRRTHAIGTTGAIAPITPKMLCLELERSGLVKLN